MRGCGNWIAEVKKKSDPEPITEAELDQLNRQVEEMEQRGEIPPLPEDLNDPQKIIERGYQINVGVRGGKTQQAREWIEANKVPAPKPTPKAPAKVHRELFPGLYIEEPATLGELEVSKGDPTNATTLDIPMVNGTILTATYGIAKARARYYFNCVMATDDFKEKRYAAVLKSAMFKNTVRLVMGWGVLKSLDKNNPEYPTMTDIFKIQRQTREDRVNQAKLLFEMVMERIDQKE